MSDTDNDKILLQVEAILAYHRAVSEGQSDRQQEGVAELRRLSSESSDAREELRRLLYDGNGNIRILAAEALSRTKSYPEDAIPVLQAVLDVSLEHGITSDWEPWVRITLGSLTNYEEHSVVAETNTWPYIYAQDNRNLQMSAIKAISRMAKQSTASWTILCLLCKNEDVALREFSREIMASDEFRQYMGKRDG